LLVPTMGSTRSKKWGNLSKNAEMGLSSITPILRKRPPHAVTMVNEREDRLKTSCTQKKKVHHHRGRRAFARGSGKVWLNTFEGSEDGGEKENQTGGNKRGPKKPATY